MTHARAVTDRILVAADYRLCDCRVLETPCADHDAFAALPRVVERDGILFGITGWNSDRGMAYYKDTAMFAVREDRWYESRRPRVGSEDGQEKGLAGWTEGR